MSEPKAVALRNLTKVFQSAGGRKVTAVHDVSLDVPAGSLVTLLGPSGCGKTTVLRLIAGFEVPTGGSIAIAGQAVTEVPPHRRGLAMVFQSYALFPHMSVFENVAYGLRMRGLGQAEVQRRVWAMMEMMRLEGYEERAPHQLSGGQQQRVALARALVVEPAVLLLDEPLSNLDARLRVQMRQEIRNLQQRLTITTIYVTHDQQEALSLSDHVVVMNRGRVEQVGTPLEVYRHPATEFVAAFIGRANFLDASVLDQPGSTVVVDVQGRPLQVPARRRWVRGEPVRIMARPEAVRLSRSGGAFAGVIRRVTFLGPEAEYEVAACGTVLTVSVPAAAMALAAGESVSVDFDPSGIHLLPAPPAQDAPAQPAVHLPAAAGG